MIKNIVFDMGNVLVNYDAEKVCNHFIQDEEERGAVCSAVFFSQEWLMLDMGIIGEADALERMKRRLKDGHAREMAGLCFEHWHEYNMWQTEGMGAVIRRLKERGFGIYLCSNASVRLLSCREVIPEIESFDGVLFSAEVMYIKPQKDIYFCLFERFSLKPEECFFIDDQQLNIDGARACGMDGYCFSDGDTDKLWQVLDCLNQG